MYVSQRYPRIRFHGRYLRNSDSHFKRLYYPIHHPSPRVWSIPPLYETFMTHPPSYISYTRLSLPFFLTVVGCLLRYSTGVLGFAGSKICYNLLLYLVVFLWLTLGRTRGHRARFNTPSTPPYRLVRGIQGALLSITIHTLGFYSCFLPFFSNTL